MVSFKGVVLCSKEDSETLTHTGSVLFEITWSSLGNSSSYLLFVQAMHVRLEELLRFLTETEVEPNEAPSKLSLSVVACH